MIGQRGPDVIARFDADAPTCSVLASGRMPHSSPSPCDFLRPLSEVRTLHQPVQGGSRMVGASQRLPCTLFPFGYFFPSPLTQLRWRPAFLHHLNFFAWLKPNSCQLSSVSSTSCRASVRMQSLGQLTRPIGPLPLGGFDLLGATYCLYGLHFEI